MTLAVAYSQVGDPEDTLQISDVDAPPAPGRGEIQVARGRPITAVTDPVGGELFCLLAPGGTLITYGHLSGEAVPLDPAVLMSRAADSAD